MDAYRYVRPSYASTDIPHVNLVAKTKLCPERAMREITEGHLASAYLCTTPYDPMYQGKKRMPAITYSSGRF